MANKLQNKAEKKQATDILADLNDIGKVCTKETGKEYIPISEMVDAVMRLAEALAEISLYDYQRSFGRRVIEAIFLREADMLTALMSRQCIAEGTVVHNRDGSMCPIEECDDSWYTGDKPVFEVRAKGGFRVTATANHPFLTKQGWKKLEQLKVGDTVYCLKEWNKFGNDEVPYHFKVRNQLRKGTLSINTELAELIGWLTADGYISRKGQSFKFTNINMRYLKRVEFLVKKHFKDVTVKWYKKGRGFDLLLTHASHDTANSLRDFVRAMDLRQGFPYAVTEYFSRESVCAFFKAMYAADGYMHYKKKRNTGHPRNIQEYECGLSCGNDLTYAQYCRELLNKLGIRGQVKHEHMLKNRNGKSFHRVVFTGAENALIFNRDIGTFDKKSAVENSKSHDIFGDLKKGKDGELLCETHIIAIDPCGTARVWDRCIPNKGWFIAGGFAVHNSGKTSVIGAIVCACMVIIPELAKQFPDDWRLNLTDDLGRYRGYKHGIDFGIYAPIMDQSQIMFERIRTYLDTNTAQNILSELGITYKANRGNKVVLSNNSSVLAMSASKNSQIEGHTHHVVLLEETQDIDTMKIRKSLHPMTASLKGLLVKIGTASTRKGDFYYSIQSNLRLDSVRDKQNHFFFPYEVCVKYNSLYKDYIEAEKIRIGEDSDEFKMSYNCQWLLERGMFLVPRTFMSRQVATTTGKYSFVYPEGCTAPHIVVGIDLGKESDSTVVTVMEADWDNPAIHELVVRDMMDTEFIAYNKHLLAWREWHGDDYEFQFHEIVAWLRKFRFIKKIVLDSTREASFSDRLAHHVNFEKVEFEPFIFGVQTKAAGYRLLHGDILSGRTTFPAGQEARKQAEYRKFVTQALDLTKLYTGGFLSVSHPDEAGAKDDYCFPAGAPVVTKQGLVAIENITVGTEVLTSKGWNKVIASMQTGVKSLIRVGNLVGTANHPVWCVNDNMYKRMDTIASDDIVLVYRQELVPVAMRDIVGDALTLQKFENMPEGEKVPVFNLSVEGNSEFVCQGVLVHNCDSWMLANWGANVPAADMNIETLSMNAFV